MKAEIKAKELVEMFKPMVNGYVGSSMLTNTEYPETIKRNAIQCAIISQQREVDLLKKLNDGFFSNYLYDLLQEAQEVLTNLKAM